MLYGDDAREIHEYLDSPYEIYRGDHRKIRHDTKVTPHEVEEIFGEAHENAKHIATDHAWFDAMDSLCKRGIITDDSSSTCFIRFMKPHFREVKCPTCKNPRTEKFATVYLYEDWKKRYRSRFDSPWTTLEMILFLPLLPFHILRWFIFGDKKEKERATQAYGNIYYCYKCHSAAIDVETDTIPRALRKIISTLLSSAVSEALSVNAVFNIHKILPEIRDSPHAPMTIQESRFMRAKTKMGLVRLGIALVWLSIGISVALFRSIDIGYAIGWILCFGFPCSLIFFSVFWAPSEGAVRRKDQTTKSPRTTTGAPRMRAKSKLQTNERPRLIERHLARTDTGSGVSVQIAPPLDAPIGVLCPQCKRLTPRQLQDPILKKWTYICDYCKTESSDGEHWQARSYRSDW